MPLSFIFNDEKNHLLKATRGIGFEDILAGIENGNLLADITHTSPLRPHQRLFVVQVGQYAYAVPYVIDQAKQEIFLKTIFPSRALTRIYIKGIKGGGHDKS